LRTRSFRRAGVGLLLCVGAVASARADGPSPLAGTWTLVAADVVRPDGTRAHDYGESPKGLLMIDAQGRYSLQIYASERPRFASGKKDAGTAAEYQAALLGCSTHFGTLAVDAAGRVMTVHLQASSYPNQEGTEQRREFVLEGDELSYRVPARPDGGVPLSVWRRLAP
jgi:lipocalin-like protein